MVGDTEHLKLGPACCLVPALAYLVPIGVSVFSLSGNQGRQFQGSQRDQGIDANRNSPDGRVEISIGRRLPVRAAKKEIILCGPDGEIWRLPDLCDWAPRNA